MTTSGIGSVVTEPMFFLYLTAVVFRICVIQAGRFAVLETVRLGSQAFKLGLVFSAYFIRVECNPKFRRAFLRRNFLICARPIFRSSVSGDVLSCGIEKGVSLWKTIVG